MQKSFMNIYTHIGKLDHNKPYKSAAVQTVATCFQNVIKKNFCRQKMFCDNIEKTFFVDTFLHFHDV